MRQRHTGEHRHNLRDSLHRIRRNIHGMPYEKAILSGTGLILAGAVTLCVCGANGVFARPSVSSVSAEAEAAQTSNTESGTESSSAESAAATNTNPVFALGKAENTSATGQVTFPHLAAAVEETADPDTGESEISTDDGYASSESEDLSQSSSDSVSGQAGHMAVQTEAEEEQPAAAEGDASENSADTQQVNSTSSDTEEEIGTAADEQEENAAAADAENKTSQNKKTENSASSDETVAVSSSSSEETAEESSEEESGRVEYLSRSYQRLELDVKNIKQNPELPTGCESVATTIVLRSIGFTDLEKCTIADEYLDRGSNLAVSYVGNPHTSSGAGCFPPAIVSAANKYLMEQGSSLRAKNLTGSTLEELLDLVDDGYPIIIWNTQGNASVRTGGNTASFQGSTYQWYYPEHCMVLYGVDREKNTVLISDPIDGKVERSYTQFEKNYDDIGQYAVVIQ